MSVTTDGYRGRSQIVSDAIGINSLQRVAQQQAAQSAKLASVPSSAVQQALVGVPGLARVPLPPRGSGEELVRPKRAANTMSAPRSQDGGDSPLATASLQGTADGADLIGERPDTPVEERAPRQGQAGTEQLPTKAGLVAYARTNGGTGSMVYLEQDRWHNHIRQHHIVEPPNARGKRTTTWWPVEHTATGKKTMNDNQVVGVIMDAVRDGHWQNAPRGTVLSVYELPSDQAQSYGVSEVKVSAAPDGRILSAYPSRGENVLAVRELSASEQAPAAQSQQPDEDDRLFKTNIANTTFG